MKKKQVMAYFLAAAMFMTASPQSIFATQTADQTETLDLSKAVKGRETGTSIREQMEQAAEEDKQDTKHDADEIVTVVIEVEADPLIEQFQNDVEEDLPTFLSESGDRRNKIQAQVQAVTEEMTGLSDGEKPEVLYTYDTVFSGLSVQVPYGQLEKIKKLPGVKSAFVAGTYKLPDVEKNPDQLIGTHMTTSRVMIGSDQVQGKADMDYTGKGQVVAIIDSGLSYKHEAFTTDPADPKYNASSVQEILDQKDLASEQDYTSLGKSALTAKEGTDASSVYKSAKVPFGYDYADHDTEVTPTNSNDHGTHVAGIVAGNSSEIQGVAPDAQLISLKVFGDNGDSNDAVLLAALQDAILLNVDAINMSLGTDAGFSKDADEAMQKAYDNVRAAGISLDVSAGNSTTSANSSLDGDDARTENIDNGIVANPSTLDAALSIASIENTSANDSMYIEDSAGGRHSFVDSATGDAQFSKLTAGSYEYVSCGYGAAEEFNGKDVKGKIALIQRGNSILFSDKVKNAANAGAVAAVIYNNMTGSIAMSIDSYPIPAVSITQDSGEALQKLAKDGVGTLKFDPSLKATIESVDANTMSTFSSWGTTPDLEIKPEVTAPGGNIYSAYYLENRSSGKSIYGLMSGTSMASPHVAGASAVLSQYIQEKMPEITDPVEKQERINSLLMSTAVPVEDKTNYSDENHATVYAPIRQQGAGLINLQHAVNAKAYLEVEGSKRPKAELGYNNEGNYSFTVNIKNTSDQEQTYALSGAVQVPNYSVNDKGVTVQSKTDSSILDDGATMTMNGKEGKDNQVTVPANSTTSVKVSIKVDGSAEKIKEWKKAFTNGFYIEGFFFAKSLDGGVDLSAPYLGFYGDWGDQSMFDASIFDTDKTPMFSANSLHSGQLSTGGATQQGSYLYYGANPFAALTGADTSYNKNRIVMSTKSQYTKEVIPNTSLLRGAEKLSYKVTDATGSTIWEQDFDYMPKTYFLQNGSFFVTAEYQMQEDTDLEFRGTDAKGNALPDGDYYYLINGTKAGVKDVKGARETLYYKVTVDNTDPQLDKEKSMLFQKDGKLYAYICASDEKGLSGIEIGIPSKSQSTWGGNNDKYIDTTLDCRKSTGKLIEVGNVSDLSTSYDLDSITVTVYDYALNYANVDKWTIGEAPKQDLPEDQPETEEKDEGLPFDPFDGSAVTKPSVPSSAEPSEASKPSKDETPSKEEKPSKDETPSREEKPSEPEKPSKEEKPSKDEIPSREEKPSEPEAPSKEEKPSRDETPSEDITPSKGSRPSRPGEGSRPSAGQSEPEKPSQEQQPGEPSQPSEADRPSKSDKPSETDRPSKADKPSETDQPSKADQPSNEDEKKDNEAKKVSITERSLTVKPGEKRTLHATIEPENATNRELTWESSDTKVATVDKEGNIVAKNAGWSMITASATTGTPGFCYIVVEEEKEDDGTKPEPSIVLDKNLNMMVGEKVKLTPFVENGDSSALTWSVVNDKIVSVDESGMVTALAAGTTTIVAHLEQNGKETIAKCEVTVTQKNETVAVRSITLKADILKKKVGEKERLEYEISPENATNKTVEWYTSNPKVAYVDAKGNMLALSAGTAVISVTTQDGQKVAYCQVEVEEEKPSSPSQEPSDTIKDQQQEPGEISVANKKLTLNLNQKKTIKVTLKPENLTVVDDLTVKSSSSKVVKVLSKKEDSIQVQAKKPGIATVILSNEKDGSMKPISLEITVKPAKVTALKKKNVKKNSISLTWKKQANVKGYRIYQYKKGGYKKIKEVTGNSVTIKGLKKKTSYKFKVKSYVKVSGKSIESNFSSEIKVKTK